jgi:hypothetical protein
MENVQTLHDYTCFPVWSHIEVLTTWVLLNGCYATLFIAESQINVLHSVQDYTGEIKHTLDLQLEEQILLVI